MFLKVDNSYFFMYNRITIQETKGERAVMGMSLKIRTILLERHMTIKELAEKIGTSGNNLSNKLSRDNLSEKELRKIADALDCDYDGIFTFRDTGKQI